MTSGILWNIELTNSLKFLQMPYLNIVTDTEWDFWCAEAGVGDGVKCPFLFRGPLLWTLVLPVTSTPGNQFIPFFSVQCLQTDIFLWRVSRFYVSPGSVFPGNKWLTSVSFFVRNLMQCLFRSSAVFHQLHVLYDDQTNVVVSSLQSCSFQHILSRSFLYNFIITGEAAW